MLNNVSPPQKRSLVCFLLLFLLSLNSNPTVTPTGRPGWQDDEEGPDSETEDDLLKADGR